MSADFVMGNRKANAHAFLVTNNSLVIGLHRTYVRPCSLLRARQFLERSASTSFESGIAISCNLQARGNLPTVDQEQGELRTITQLVLDAAEVTRMIRLVFVELTLS